MLSKFFQPSKNEIVKKLNSTNSNKISVVEVIDRNSRGELVREIDKKLVKGNLSVILIEGDR